MLRAALADAPSRRFFTAHAQSCLGSGLAHVVLPLMAYKHTGSAWAVTAVLIPDLLPAIVFAMSKLKPTASPQNSCCRPTK